MQKDFRIICSLKNRTNGLQLAAKFRTVHDVAIVSERHRAIIKNCFQGLNIKTFILPCRGVTIVSHGGKPLEAIEIRFLKNVSDQTKTFVLKMLFFVKRNNSRSLLSAMLKSVEPQVSHSARFGMIPDTKNSTLITPGFQIEPPKTFDTFF